MGQPLPPPAGWHPDPSARFEFRYFNGRTWTADVSVEGRRFIDPLGAPRPRRDGRATAAMVLGIVGATTGWMPFVFVVGAVCSVLAIVFGTIVLRRRGEPRAFALTGVITGIAGLVLVVLGVVTTRVVSDAVNDFIDEPPAVVELQRCEATGDALTIEGSIENVGDESSDYRIVVAVAERTSNVKEVVIEVDDVRPGAPQPFGVTTELDGAGGTDEVTCDVVDVTGPFPFGLEI